MSIACLRSADEAPMTMASIAVAHRWALVLAIGLFGSGCSSPADLSRTAKYQGEVGSQYRTKTALYALGLKSSDDPKRIERIWISPFRGTDSNVAWSRPIPVGQIFRVTAVRRGSVLLDNGLQFLVATESGDFPHGVEIVIPLYGYMESADGFPDSTRFERLTAPELPSKK